MKNIKTIFISLAISIVFLNLLLSILLFSYFKEKNNENLKSILGAINYINLKQEDSETCLLSLINDLKDERFVIVDSEKHFYPCDQNEDLSKYKVELHKLYIKLKYNK